MPAPAPLPVKRRALCIGINYTGTSYQLAGCINDQINLTQKLQASGLFSANDMVVMNDTCTGTAYPTFSNMWTQLIGLRQWVAQWPATQPIQLVVSYSGHGTQRPSFLDAGEQDYRNETILPIDFSRSGFITDDMLRLNFISLLPRNVTLLLLVDACNSGTVADLRYSYNLDAVPIALQTNSAYPEFSCTCVSLSACADNQTAVDAWLPDPVTGVYESQGALTAAFCALFTPTTPVKQLAAAIRARVLGQKFTQLTQLCSSKPLADGMCPLC